MLVTLLRETAVTMYDYITEYWQAYLVELKARIESASDEQEALQLQLRYDKAARN